MKYLVIALAFLFSACNSSHNQENILKNDSALEELAIYWTDSVKSKIINENSLFNIDSTKVDSFENKIRKGYKIYKYHQGEIISEFGFELPNSDTLFSMMVGRDNNYSFVKEHCPPLISSVEGIKFNKSFVGIIRTINCSVKSKSVGFYAIDEPIGVWTEYDSIGNIIEQTDYGNFERIKGLNSLR